jgi:hypothetical protein
MNWQEIASLGIVALTSLLFIRRGVRSLKKKQVGGCEHCARNATPEHSLNLPGNWRTLKDDRRKETA